MNTFPVQASTLSALELGNFLKEKYHLNEDYQCKLFRTGLNHTYFLEYENKKFVARVYCHNWRTKNEIKEELQLLKLLKDQGLGVSYAIADKNGAYIQEIEAPEGLRYITLFSFAKGKKIRSMSNKTCFAIGSVMAKMHQTTINKRIDRVQYNSEILINTSYENLKLYFTEDLPVMRLLKKIGNKLTKTLAQIPETSFPNGIVHLDIWYDNLNINDKNEITLFDFDNCGNGVLVLDVAYFCIQLFFIENNKEVYELKLDHFLKGYNKKRELSSDEINLIPSYAASIFIFYLGVQAKRFDWSNIFLTENYLKMFVGRINTWLEYYKTKELNCIKHPQ